ncbi:cytochrome c oxidase subunit II [Tuberibacillus sp. Marseille-P3662]|uniref:cytochrome c oxidase subunit II n=1 Tax=Tuberibacillus sp. Marseille-P3662 TaxID=1965358 RepID=UPI000A1CBC25|nr:cytochrome c oxidase subunit II [Tuberibacillus sp. Marseille-P3662]
MLKRWQHLWRWLPITALALVLSGCGKQGVSALDPLGEVAERQANLMLISIAIMVVVVLVVGFLFTYALIRYRKRSGQEEHIPKQVEGNTKLELLWTIIPIVLLAILAVPTIQQTFALSDTNNDSKKDDVLKVKVTANQYWWEFTYPDKKVTTAQDLYVPKDKKVVFELTSNDVVHSFWLPAFGGKQDVNPGLTNEMWLTFDELGTFKGRCAELCGQSHALMYFNVKVMEQDDFDQWIKDMKNGAEKPDQAVAQKGQKLFKKNCVACHATDTNKKGMTGPNLTNFADRENLAGVAKNNNKDALKKWIKDPDNLKQGTSMIAFKDKLSNDQINAIAEYLSTLSVDD